MAIERFVYQGSPQRVVFGAGSLADLPGEVERLGLKHVLVLSTPGQEVLAQGVAGRLGGLCAAVFPGARMHTPAEVTDDALALVADRRIDGTVAIGGGSTIGLGKAIALRTNLPQVAVPTTYAGSEATNILGETVAGTKKTVRDPRILPEVVMYDADLTLTLPVPFSVASGMNAIAHAVEGSYAHDGNPLLSLMADEGLRALASALSIITRTPIDRGARAEALYGTWLCGRVLGGTSMGLHHKLCHVLGGTFDLRHAETHAIVLPHVAAYNGDAAPAAMRRIARALGVPRAPEGLFDLLAGGGGPVGLRDIGMPEAGLDQAADLATADPYWNPRPADRDQIRALLGDAWRGQRPHSA